MTDEADFDESGSSYDGFSDDGSEQIDRMWMQQESRAMERRSRTVGFREGVDAGKEETLQEGFNAGYVVGASQGFRSGVLQGLLRAYTSQFPNLVSSNHTQLLAAIRAKEQASIDRGDIPSTDASDMDAVHNVLAPVFPNLHEWAPCHDKANHVPISRPTAVSD
ncbi:hypothetical protein H310_06817 [Aphanomyces invadans]|uniref:Essential protein Yae1 N-terminal domain-containing protein n=1 Tax=Aphanomyces invadans TaxID=157072 RepID=A0A024U484_9STRA|nr:hypothetical protein H310_06817 [Aphanomyces invadans]ETW01231.1 hypothetical protein H310_06817 [Aphanomyces invadans]|eukprot:XP_008870229.1 hypothetical protein H310_06817 [Aphanomyces invadans]